MGILEVTTGTDLMSGQQSNVISDYEGTAMLAPLRNLNPDPLLEKLDHVTNAPYYWNMKASPKPTGWLPFVKDTNVEKNFSRQTTAPLSMGQNILEVPDELVPGSTPRDSKDTVDIAAPLIPKVETFQVSSHVGFPAGWYCLAHDWVLAGRRSTGPGERSEPFFLAQGQGFEFAPPTEIPDGALYMQPYITRPQASSAAALTASLYGQRSYNVKTMPRRIPMHGPLVTTNKSDGKNYSYIGDTNSLPPIRVANYSARLGYGGWSETISLGYRFVTEQGEGMSAALKQVNLVWTSDDNALLLWAVPPRTPAGATGWILEILSQDPEDGALTKYDVKKFGGTPFRVNEWAPVYGGQPEYLVAGANVEMTSNTATVAVDNTGMEASDDIMETPSILDLDSSGLTPGKHYVKTALTVDEEEGPVSNYKMVNVPFGHGLRIHKPRWHERIDNHDLTDKNVNNIPRNWSIFSTESNATIYTERKNVIRITDNTTNTTDASFFTSPPAELDTQYGRYTLDMRFRWMDYVRGVVSVHMIELDKDNNKLGEQELEVLGRNAKDSKANKQGVLQNVNRKYRLSKRVEDTAGPRVFKMNANTSKVHLEVRGRIRRRKSTTDPRAFDAEISDFSMSAGWATPRVVDVDLERLSNRSIPAPPPLSVADTLYQNFSRPHGGYCLVVEDPIDGPKEATYTTKDFTIFESGTNEDWQHNQASAVAYINRVERAAALYGQYGLTLAKTADGTGANNVTKTFTPSTSMSISWEMFIDTFSLHDIELGSIRDTNGAALARVTLKANGEVEVRHSSTKVQTVDLAIDDGNTVHFELSCRILSGEVTLTFGIDEDNRSQVVTITDIDFSTFQNAATAILGNSADGAVNDFARFDFKYGKIEISDLQVLSNVVDSPGNYIEYYGPEGTPKNSKYGPTGMRIPAKGQNSYTFGVSIWHEDMTANSSLFKVRARDKNHNTLRTYSAIVPNMTGDKRMWRRHTKTISTPPKTAYLEFYENDLGAGILKIHGIQIEEGATATQFSYARQLNGWFNNFLRTRQGAIEKGDPAYELSLVKKLRNVLIAHVDTSTVSIAPTYRAGDTLAEISAQPYTTSYNDLDVRKSIIEVRIDMASTVEGHTPEIRSIQLDLDRRYSQLLRPDGTEYAGGTVAFDISTPHAPPNMEIFTKASGAKEAQTWGTVRTRNIKFRVAAFRRSDVEEIIGQEEHILEMPHARYTITPNESPDFLAEPDTRVYFPDGREFFQREIAEFEGFITYEEALSDA